VLTQYIKGTIVTPTRQERKENITRKRKQQILEAALAVFSEKGFAQATTAEIARSAGVAEGTIYNYFKSKRELLIAVIRELIITIPLLDLIERIPGADIADTFKQILQNRFNLIETGPVSRIPPLMGEIVRDPELKALWSEQFVRPFFTRLEEGYRVLAASGKFRRFDPAVAVRAIGGLILGFLILKMMEGEASPLDRLPREKVAEEMTEFILHGLLAEKGKENSV
jgi:AcrR family transcriptional regulator